MKVANIIFEGELVNHNKVSYINYFNKPIEYDNFSEKDKPTLYVGWKFLKDNNPSNDLIQNVDILEKTVIENKLYWEFSFEEKKSEHVNGILDFTIETPNLFFSNICVYENINPIFHSIKTEEDLFKKLPQNIDLTYVSENGSFLYLLVNAEKKKIIGIDLNLFNYFNFGSIVNKIKDISVEIVDDVDGKVSKEALQPFSHSKNMKKYLPIILNK